MISVGSPSMAINDSRAAVNYEMDYTIKAFPATTMALIADAIVQQSNRINKKIDNLILTAHGEPANFHIGTGLNLNSMIPLEAIKGKVNKIWFRGCLIGRIMSAQTASEGDGPFIAGSHGNGHAFLSAFANLTGCYVVAPTEMQVSNLRAYPKGVMDSYEGLVLCYDRQGNVSWRRRYPSLYGYNATGTAACSPNSE